MCHSVFFFSSRRRHTRLQGDWSSDVCSSDLSASRSSSLPDVPTMEEAGMPGFRTSTWYGLWAPKNTPQDVVQKLWTESRRVLAEPQIAAQYRRLGAEPRSEERRVGKECRSRW